MARKPPDWRQPSLFPPDPAMGLSSAKAEEAGQAPANTPELQDNATSQPDGDHHAVQEHDPSTPATTAADARAAPEEPEAAFDNGTLRQGAEDQPRSLEGAPFATEARE